MDTAERFRDFALVAGAQGSPLYEAWARGIAADDAILRLIDRARPGQRQPVLVLAVCRWLGAPIGEYAALRAWMLDHSEAWLDELDRRLTQTNDVRRTAPVALALAAAGIDGPVSLLEVGAAAGLGLYPDRYGIRVATSAGERVLGDPASPVRLDVRVEGRAAQDPGALPEIVHRAGLDLAPLDPRDPADALWLETLLWPGQTDRVELLRAALEVARRDPAHLRALDAVDGLETLVASAAPGSTPVVVTAGTLVYLPGARRQAFVDEIGRLGVRWVSYERTGLLTGVHDTLPEPRPTADDPDRFATLALDGAALATGDAHGTRLRLAPCLPDVGAPAP
ncbi:DUF2332 domain-containing protein [Frondihabitans peucedani]|uniref:DUF2332 domain-containing protein n=1 Tax=Frondihabitans peucedani TaxID=598626 RepID=A0ABP8E6R3_9MICO